MTTMTKMEKTRSIMYMISLDRRTCWSCMLLRADGCRQYALTTRKPSLYMVPDFSISYFSAGTFASNSDT